LPQEFHSLENQIDARPPLRCGMMDRDTRNAAIAAVWIMLLFGIAAFYLPTIMLALGSLSTVLAGAFGIVFVLAFFSVFWLRARNQRKNQGK
jgi:uncharacterized membrane protein